MAEIFEWSPEEFGLIKLPIPVPPMLESALGYPGNERYVMFHECGVTSTGFFIEDADHKWPGVEAGWSLFCKHPAVARVLEVLGLDLKRAVPIMSWEKWMALPTPQREAYWSKTRYLILDRQKRMLYVGILPNLKMFLITATATSSEPGTDDPDDEIAEEDIDALRQSGGSKTSGILDEEPKLDVDAALDVGRDALERLRSWLDEHEPLEKDYTPRPKESCGFRSTNIRVERGQIEEAFGYRGGKRYISLHWSPKANQVVVCDGIGRWWFSSAADTWNQFLNHPLIKPHLQVWEEGEKPSRSVQIDFTAQIDKLSDSPLFSTEESAREMEADVKTNCLLYDRAGNEVYAGSWASALFFHSLVQDVLEEDLVSDPRPAAVPLLTWLTQRRDEPEHLFGAAASYQQHHQEQDALEMLRRCIEREPDSHLYWFRFSQTLGSLSQWEDALEACEKAIGFHTSAPRQYVTARYMLNWRAQCLFMLQRYTEAADAYRLAIEIDDSAHKADSYSQLARCYERMGSYDEAINARELQVRDRADSLAEALRCREAEEVDDEIVEAERSFLGEAWLELGRCYVLDGNFEAAEWAFRRAIDVTGQCIRASAELGVLLGRLGRAEEAGRQLQHAMALATAKIEGNPTLGSAHSELAFVYRAMGNPEAAAQEHQRATELGWKSSDEERRVVSMGPLDQSIVS